MRDYFRTVLVNEPFVSYSEGIAANFAPVNLPPALKNFYDVLFPPGSTHNYKLFLADNFTKIIEAAGLGYAMTLDDNRVTFTLPDSQFFYSGSPYTFDFNALYNKLKANEPIISAMLNVSTNYPYGNFQHYWYLHFNPVYQVAGLIIDYVNRVDYK